jgi:hypothetical protein
MKKICYVSLILLVSVWMVFAQTEKYDGMKGTETPTFQTSSNAGKCFVFSEYVVKTDQIDADGENISVYKRGTSASAKSACQTKGKAYLYIKDADNNSFYGLLGAYLFVDSGTSVDSRGLEIYNLTSRKSIITKGYMGDAKLVERNFVIFDSPSDKKGSLKTCKEAAKWKRDGGGVGWMQSKKLDLQTLKEISVGGLRCYYME